MISTEQQALIGDFFRENTFMRVAAAATVATTLSDPLVLLQVVAPTLIGRVCDVLKWTAATSIHVVFEDNHRARKKLRAHFGGIRVAENGADIPFECYFMPKRAGEPALEVADFIMHAVHGLARDRLNDRDGYRRRDFQSVFHSVDRRLASFMLIDNAQFTLGGE